MSYDDNNPEHRKQLNEYLTKPSRHLDRVIYKKPTTPQKAKPEFDVASNIMMTAYKYDDVDKGTEKEIRNYLIKKIDSGKQLNSDEVRFMMDTKGPTYSKEASPQQMAELKKKIDKYKDVHFPKQKPFNKPTLKDKPVRKPTAVPPKTETYKADPRLQKIEEDLRALDIIQKPDPEPTVEEIIKERSQKRLEAEQRAYDQMYGTGGIVKLWRPQ